MRKVLIAALLLSACDNHIPVAPTNVEDVRLVAMDDEPVFDAMIERIWSRRHADSAFFRASWEPISSAVGYQV